MDDPARVWMPEVIQRVAAFLPGNEVAVTVRLVDRTSSRALQGRCEVSLEEPLPNGAAAAFAAHWSAPGACRGLDFLQRRKLLRRTATETGDLDMLAAAAKATGVALDRFVFDDAAKAGKLAVCQWMCETGRLPPGTYLRWFALWSAAEGGKTDVCEWALDLDPRRYGPGPDELWYATAVQRAARGGHVDTVDCLLARSSGRNTYLTGPFVLEAAAVGCDLAAFQRLCGRQGGLAALTVWNRDHVLTCVVASRHPDWKAKAEWCMEQGCELGAGCAKQAAHRVAVELEGGAVVERLAWLEEQGHGLGGGGGGGEEEDDSDLLTTAIEMSNAAAVRYLLGLGLRSTADVDWADCDLDLEVLQALHGAGCDLGSPGTLAARACRCGQQPILEWLLETYGGAESVGGLWDCFTSAVRSGNVRLVRWLRERLRGEGVGPAGCMPPEGARRSEASAWGRQQQVQELWHAAAASGSEELLDLLLEWGCPLPVHEPGEASQVWAAAAWNDDLRTLQVLRRLGGGTGLPWGSAATFESCLWDPDAARGPHVHTLEWLVAEGCPVDWARAESVARERVVSSRTYDGEGKAVLEWVREQRARRESLGGLRRSVRSARDWAVGRLDVVRGVLAAARR